MPFGEIAGYPEGSQFESRLSLHRAGLHRHTQAGISWRENEGADAIVLNGGYEDEDLGDVIIYMGEGGNVGRQQVADQEFKKGNRALATCQARGLPVRVVRGSRPPPGRRSSQWSPKWGYVYSGLYVVDEHWHERERSGFVIYRFRLLRNRPGLDADNQVGQVPGELPAGADQPQRTAITASRIIRDTQVTQWVKAIHDFQCQVCGVRLEVPAGPRAEGAHIRPLGRPHNGPDASGNVLCLCPNHHVLFDEGGFAIADDYGLLGIEGRLRRDPRHALSLEQIRYHREHFWTED